jgi:arsenate reductase
MKKVTIYHNSDCSKSIEVLQILEDAKVDLEVIEYLDEPPSPEMLDSLLKQLKMDPQDLVRRGEEEYKMLKLGLQPPRNRDAWLRILHQYPVLIERPIVSDGRTAVIGRPPKKVLDWLKME